jgi:hypothetical protein
LAPATGLLQLSELLLSLGISLEVQEKPYEFPVQPVTFASAAQLLVVPVTQQYRVSPSLPVMPAPHESDGSPSLGGAKPGQV